MRDGCPQHSWTDRARGSGAVSRSFLGEGKLAGRIVIAQTQLPRGFRIKIEAEERASRCEAI